MKTITFTAVMAVLVAIPFILKKTKLQPVPSNVESNGDAMTDESRRYAIDDFLT